MVANLKSAVSHDCKKCGQKYKTVSGLWKHEKKNGCVKWLAKA